MSILLLFFSAILAVSCGAVRIPPQEIFNIIAGKSNVTSRIILVSLRLPRVLEAGIVGAGLSVVGAAFQGLFRNPMADPYVLGVSSGAAFGATIAIILGLGMFGTGLAAFITAIVTISIVYIIARTGTKVSMTAMLLCGIAISAFLSAFISLMMLLNHNELSRIVFWTMGSFSLISWNQVYYSAPIISVGAILMYVYARDLNAIMTGEEIAEHLGINTELVKKVILVAGSLITATAVSIGGIIGFVGLIVPHIARLLVGSDNRILIPFCAVSGAAFLMLADTLSRIVLSPSEIPIGIITAAFGGPFFLYLLIKAKTKYEGM